MTSRFSVHVKTVQKAIAKFGQTVTYNQTTAVSVGNPWEGATSKGPDISLKILFLAPSATGETQFGKELLTYLKGTETSKTQVRGYMAYNGFEPAKSDIVVRDGKELVIGAVDTLAPDGTSILHVLEFE